jgi:hypothetical protein
LILVDRCTHYGKRMNVVCYNVYRGFLIGRTAKPLFAVLFSTGARLNARFLLFFAVRFPTDTRQTQIFLVCFHWDARQCLFTNVHPNFPLLAFPDVNFCRAPWPDARQRHIICLVFRLGAKQTRAFAVRFVLAHDKVFF